MTVSADQLRTDFPEFADTTAYPDSGVNLWLGLAAVTLPENLWGAWWVIGQELFACHHLVLAALASGDVADGNTPGEVTGATSAKAVDKVSVSYDPSTVSLTDGGFWNMSRYGIQFLQFARMIGAGGRQF